MRIRIRRRDPGEFMRLVDVYSHGTLEEMIAHEDRLYDRLIQEQPERRDELERRRSRAHERSARMWERMEAARQRVRPREVETILKEDGLALSSESVEYLTEIERRLDMPRGEKRDVLRELISHYLDNLDELLATGTEQGQAEVEAAKRIGEPQDVAGRLNPVHCRSGWRSAALTGVPFAAAVIADWAAHALVMARGAVKPAPIAIVLALAALFVAGAVRELRAGRRPIWLPTWLAVGAYLGMRSLLLVGWAFPALGVQSHAAHLAYAASVWILVPVGAMLVACWGRGKLFIAAWVAGVAFAAYGVAAAVILRSPDFVNASIAKHSIALWMTGLFVLPLPWAFIGHVVFSEHPYANRIHSMLFMLGYAFVMLGWMVSRGPYLGPYIVMRPELLYMALISVVFARASSWRGRRSVVALANMPILAAGFVLNLVSGIGPSAPHAPYIRLSATAPILIVWVIVPEILAMREAEAEAGLGVLRVGRRMRGVDPEDGAAAT